MYTCPSTYVIPDYSSRSFFGMFGGTERPSKTYSSLPPHWSLSVRFDILLFYSLESVDYFEIFIDSTAYGSYIKQGGGAYIGICSSSDTLVFYNKNITTHTASSVLIEF